MTKEIRFSILVQKAGRPEAMTLWAKPKDNPVFMKAVNENRILTVFQKPAGTKKDFGAIGFHQEKFATYLVFPKRLPKLGDVHVIGIKYGLLKVPVENRPGRKDRESTSAGKKAITLDGSHLMRDGSSESKAKPESDKQFDVRIKRTATMETTITVSAKSIAQAEGNALKMVTSQDFQPDDVRDEVKSIVEN